MKHVIIYHGASSIVPSCSSFSNENILKKSNYEDVKAHTETFI